MHEWATPPSCAVRLSQASVLLSVSSERPECHIPTWNSCRAVYHLVIENIFGGIIGAASELERGAAEKLALASAKCGWIESLHIGAGCAASDDASGSSSPSLVGAFMFMHGIINHYTCWCSRQRCTSVVPAASQAARIVHLRLARDLHNHLLAGKVPHNARLVPPRCVLCWAVLHVVLEENVSRAHDLWQQLVYHSPHASCSAASHASMQQRTFTAPSVALMCHLPLIVTTNWT